jgi:DNA-binding GntR family transcriptional regulator
MRAQKGEKLREKVYSTLKKRILSFELKPGERFFETEMAENLGVSRTPIREAFNRLEQEGLIKALPKRGYAVSDVTSREIEELYEIREALEILALRAAVKACRKNDWIRLERILYVRTGQSGEGSKKLHSPDFDEAHKFHEEIFRISGKETLRQIYNMVSDKINRFQRMDLFHTDRAGVSHEEHIEIVKFLKQGKLEEAVSAAQGHIRRSKDTILNFLSKRKDLLYID